MSKVSKIIGVVAAVVAVAASIAIIFATGGAAAPVVIPGLLSTTLGTVAAVASAVSAVAMTISQATAKKPDAQGTVNNVVIGKNMPVPYAIGRTYLGGMQIYDKATGGATRTDRSQIMLVTAAGPIQGFESILADYVAVGLPAPSGGNISGAATDYYAGFLWADTRLGLRPETAFASIGGRPALSFWGSTYKASGYAGFLVDMVFDKKGERFSSGVPAWGAVFKGVKVYDPRLDSTYPGGSGANRWNDESTFAYGTGANPAGENPAIHALNYARGRFIEKTAAGAAIVPPKKLLGCGFDFSEIEVDQFVELANICDANGWKVGGAIYEAPGGSKWNNLKQILAAAAAEPVWAGGKLGVKFSAPKTSVVTIGLPDLADGEVSVQAMKSWRDKVNTVVPRVRLEAQKWEYTQLTEVTASTYVTEDGEIKSTEVQFDLVQQKDQGAELAAYTLVNGREFGPITLTVKPYFAPYQVGEAVSLNIDELGLTNQLAIILSRQIDPSNGTILLTLESETTAKHAFALGQTGVAPPSPTIVPPSDLDQSTGGEIALSIPQITALVLNSWPVNLTLSIATTGAVTLSSHNRVYADKTVAVTGAVAPIPSGTVAGDFVAVFYDDADRLGGAVTYQSGRLPGGLGESGGFYASATNPYRHFVAMLPVPASGSNTGGSGSTGGGGGSPGGGWTGEGGIVHIP